ncbi:Methyl-CpG-binding domain protein [Paramyrothecium foliicola]|nr:Methyl-CpG-binding domain protein [Paramyrothecium foliicola]
MTPRFGHDVLAPFNFWDDARGYLADVIEAHTANEEVRKLWHESLLAGSQDWHYMIDCANSLKDADRAQHHRLDGEDLLTFMWNASKTPNSDTAPINPWADTDRLIAELKVLERNAGNLLTSFANVKALPVRSRAASSHVSARRNTQSATSHYWVNEQQPEQPFAPPASEVWAVCSKEASWVRRSTVPKPCSAPLIGLDTRHRTVERAKRPSDQLETHGSSSSNRRPALETLSASTGTESHYFNAVESSQAQSRNKRPLPGIISSMPFPPLTAPSFGLVQEKLAHEPFWLLIAVTFLIKTKGSQAIPALYKVKERFPTPSHLVNPAIKEELLEMIRHLGLSVVRVAYIQKYAALFLEMPPKEGIRYKVKTYKKKGAQFLPQKVTDIRNAEDPGDVMILKEDAEAWEIGHMTSGKYAIDSWRIFCRDELLGLADDWNGKGREPEFQPEWMRVMPDDKELRAYLRWMWMREGWEWNPATGERTVLRAELQVAVNEGRVEYDNTGGLHILEGHGRDTEAAGILPQVAGAGD